jgi:hypothetical protein
MIQVGITNILDGKVVDNKCKHDGVQFVVPEPGGGDCLVVVLAGKVTNMSAKCRPGKAKCRHFWPTSPCRGDTKPILTQYFCVGDCRHSPNLYASTRATYSKFLCKIC